jgi:hypothetical protein
MSASGHFIEREDLKGGYDDGRNIGKYKIEGDNLM